MSALSPWVMLGIGAGAGLVMVVWGIAHYRNRLATLRREMDDLTIQTNNARSTRDAVGEVIGSMTQRVIGPIQNIVGFGRVLEQSSTATEAQRNIAKAVSDSARQLEQVLGDALGVSLSTTGSLSLEQDRVDVRELMAGVARSVRSRCIRNQLKFALLLGPDLPRVVTTDGTKLRYVLQNMINEVISTTDAGGGITLSAARWLTPTPGSNEVRLTFEACGGESPPGIEPGSPKARKIAGVVGDQAHDRPADQLRLAEQFTRVLGGSVIALEGAGGGLNLHAEVMVLTDKPHLADVIDIDEFQTGFVDPNEAGFFGAPANNDEHLVELMLLDQKAQ